MNASRGDQETDLAPPGGPLRSPRPVSRGTPSKTGRAGSLRPAGPDRGSRKKPPGATVREPPPTPRARRAAPQPTPRVPRDSIENKTRGISTSRGTTETNRRALRERRQPRMNASRGDQETDPAPPGGPLRSPRPVSRGTPSTTGRAGSLRPAGPDRGSRSDQPEQLAGNRNHADKCVRIRWRELLRAVQHGG